FVPHTDVRGDERQVQAGGRRVERDRMLRAAVLSEVRLEALHARPWREPAGTQGVDDGIGLGFGDVGQVVWKEVLVLDQWTVTRTPSAPLTLTPAVSSRPTRLSPWRSFVW